MALSRRRFLGTASAALLAGPLALGCRGARGAAGASGEAALFRHGVASGDPGADRVILWTRVHPGTALAREPVPVAWALARDPQLREIAASGSAAADPARDWTVKVDAVGLEPGRSYWYRFSALGQRSPVGRTRTLPAGSPERVRLAAASCANYTQGYFTAYAQLAERRDLDAVLHLGDYLYEYANGVFGDGAELGRLPEPLHETVTLADYRARYACYRSDPDLQALHASHPVIAVWDDHESANNSWRGGAENHDPRREGAWQERVAAAARAWREWLPVREVESDGAGRINRSFRFGDLAHLCMLDARLVGRDEQAPRGDLAAARDAGRTLLGADQQAWLLAELSRARREEVAWRVLGQQVVFAPVAPPGEAGNTDAWDGYRASRARIFDHLEREAIRDLVVLTGDVHSSWALDVPRDPWARGGYDAATGRGSLAVEMVAPAVSAAALGTLPAYARALANPYEQRPHLKLLELMQHGYVLLDLDRERARGEWWFVESVAARPSPERLGAAFATRRGANHLERA